MDPVLIRPATRPRTLHRKSTTMRPHAQPRFHRYDTVQITTKHHRQEGKLAVGGSEWKCVVIEWPDGIRVVGFADPLPEDMRRNWIEGWWEPGALELGEKRFMAGMYMPAWCHRYDLRITGVDTVRRRFADLSEYEASEEGVELLHMDGGESFYRDYMVNPVGKPQAGWGSIPTEKLRELTVPTARRSLETLARYVYRGNRRKAEEAMNAELLRYFFEPQEILY